MTENPFASPALSAEELRTEVEPTHRNGPFMMAVLGAVFGVLVLGLTGGGTAGLIGIGGVMMSGDQEIVMLAVLTGGLLAGIAGAPVGLVLGIIAGVLRKRARRQFVFFAAFPGAVLGLLGSFLEGAILADEFLNGLSPVLVIVAAVIMGGVGGAAGGLWLGRVLAFFAWGPVEQKQPENAEKTAPTADIDASAGFPDTPHPR